MSARVCASYFFILLVLIFVFSCNRKVRFVLVLTYMLKPHVWQRIGAPAHIIDWVSDGVPNITSHDPGHFQLDNRHMSLGKCQCL